ncbi:transcriptional regulator [Nocardia cyriacigeorgica]|uniref:Transcriptional regulator n=1 Tax=Nocardia cyriacigeorgica TaxID=135487 RepID=A0A6P1DCI4_9NOCA|nr:transcriptional regulator [Nocardia cyriacigeorgica]NEW46874.1 transcriptional regulator [Nocardia cyriacigeorgica]NEW53652.1 transcriptional regulator [Nocardia cyriacigeorgica]NEW59401.1 transcriptional regulator [Nocardia cyriacigeorgica]
MIALVVVAALACLALGWWQWERFESSSGTGQNLGYALQWPLFAAFAVFAYFRFVRLESEAEEEQSAPAAEPAPAAQPARAKTRKAAPREIPTGILPERPKARPEQPEAARGTDPALTEYNQYLARLHADDIGERVRDAGLDARDTERSAG